MSQDLTPQQRTILEYLQAGRTLTNQIALNNLGIGSLTSRVAELRSMGHGIKEEWGSDFHGKRYKKYALLNAMRPEQSV